MNKILFNLNIIIKHKPQVTNDTMSPTRTHLIHYGPDSGEATTFPLIVFSIAPHEGYIQMVLSLGTPKVESRNCPGLDFRGFGHS
jgi:hypothetical protein